MNIKQTMRNLVLGGLLLIPVVAAVGIPVNNVNAAKCGGTTTAIISCTQDNEKDANGDGKKDVEDTGVWGLLIIAINIMTAGVGVLALAGLVYGGVLYASAGGSPEQVKKARGIITNVVIGVVAFAAMYTFLNFLIPGGVFN